MEITFLMRLLYDELSDLGRITRSRQMVDGERVLGGRG